MRNWPPKKGGDPFGAALRTYGNQVLPTPAPSGSQLQAEFDAAKRSQHRALMEQKWGNTVTTQGWVALGLLGPETVPSFEMVNIGPFEEPRAIALEESFDPVLSLSPIDLEHVITLGIGQAITTWKVSQLPHVVLAQQVQVATRRVDAGFGLQPLPISVWAAPHVPRSWPTPILSENIHFTAGGSDAVTGLLVPPRGATHVMASGDPVTLFGLVGHSTIWARISMRPFPENASAGTTIDVLHQMVSMVDPAVAAAGNAGSMAPTILPIPLGQVVQWRWFRSVSENAAAGDITVTWLRG